MKLRILTVLVISQIFFSGCEKFLDVKPQDILAPEAYYETEKDLEHSLAGIYDVLGNNVLYGGQILFNYALDGDDGYCSRVSTTTGPMLYDFTSSDPFVTNHWNTLYIGINRANLLLENIDSNPSISKDIRNRVRGEASFLRAYFYFLLVQTYGEVPIVLASTKSTSNTDIEKSSIKEVYDVILKDMEYAEEHVRDINEAGGGRVNKSAVRGILARVCLFMAGYPLKDVSKYEDAKNWALKVINDGNSGHRLNASYSQIFINYAKDFYDVKESIWEVEFYGDIANGFDETGWNGYVNSPSSTLDNIKSLSFVAATANLYNKYDLGDTRRDWNIANFSYNATGGKTYSNSTSYASLFVRPAAKFRREYELNPVKKAYATPQNFPILRFSDILLMYAEALNEISFANKSEVVKYLEMVRERAFMKKGSVKSITVNNRGSNYSVAPTITITGGGGSGAKAYAVLNGSKQISGILLERDGVIGSVFGEGYTSVPTVTITTPAGATGSGGIATAVLFDGTEHKVPALATVNQEALRKFIQEERSRELAFECLRKADLIRWEKFLENMQDVYNTISQQVPPANYANYINRYQNVNSKHLLWPIPSRELSLNSKLKQNNNW
ncbi:RagB/SusD domain protein [Pseudopedobacter saltans DSM 12145]|uniref:RagB/SusD domain protein n=1 Tax=Pseudopedobacter saltans (strain ATCC 51119 / DSM 12145 / JCM 21818 / CCUG 39354 / LMG 10337 / NBRC 100064 / NCIMB 13643) TaxID=762903 RepID=F0SBM0_PSESL|nr:RagB/SusD family nutrient uptake outer membrane protein [Pseudopedobacter saltans]ADY51666.1 RagB/SusD domain protein [Pseudopedobacter saltans DSM 12145]